MNKLTILAFASTLVIFAVAFYLLPLFRRKKRNISALSAKVVGSDSRIYKRLAIKKSTRVFVKFDDENQLYDAWVADYSEGGLCMLFSFHPRTLSSSPIIYIKSVNHLDHPWTPVEIRYCQPTPGGFQVGVKFVDHPQSKIIRSFSGRN